MKDYSSGSGGSGGGGGGGSIPFYPTSRGGLSSTMTPRLIIERQTGTLNGNVIMVTGEPLFTIKEDGSNISYTNLSVDELIARVRGWA